MFRLFVSVNLLLLLFACSTENGANPEEGIEATYSTISTQIFDVRCSCHLNSHPDVILRSDVAYNNIVSQPSSTGMLYVSPGSPDNSYLYKKVLGVDIVGDRMPKNGPPYLEDDEIEAIRKWIADGALNN